MSEVLALARFQLRARRKVNAIWLLSLGACLAMFPAAYYNYYPNVDDRAVLVESMRTNTATRALYGVLGEPGTLGQLINWEVALWIVLLGAVMAVLHFSAVYRGWEQSGQLELVRAAGSRRHVPLSAALVSSVALCVGLGVLAFLALGTQSLIFDELTWSGAGLFALMVTLSCCGSVLLAGLFQLFSQSSPGRVGMASLGLSYCVRAYADATDDAAWLNWLSPLGWKAVIDPYGANSAAACAGVAGACLVACAVLALADAHRPYSQSLVGNRRRRKARKAREYATVPAILWRLSRSPRVTWLIAVTAVEAFMVSLSGSIKDMIAQDANTGQMFAQLVPEGDLISGFIIYITMFSAMLITVATVSLMLGHRSMEREGKVDLFRAAGRARISPLAEEIAVVFATLVLMLLGVFAGGALSLDVQLWDVLGKAVASQLGPTVFFLGISALLVGVAPRMANLAWLPVVVAALISTFGELFSFPEWLVAASPFGMTYTLADAHVPQTILLVIIGAACAGLGLVGMRRRAVAG